MLVDYFPVCLVITGAIRGREESGKGGERAREPIEEQKGENESSRSIMNIYKHTFLCASFRSTMMSIVLSGISKHAIHIKTL